MNDDVSAAQLEAEGATEVTFTFRDRPVTIPLDVGVWPAVLIRAHPLAAVLVMLGDQADAVLGARPVLDDARELSDAMAAAAGVARLPETPATPDVWFGGLPTLLRMVQDYPDDVELDLRRLGVDYRDRWRGTLTLRQIWVCIRRSTPTSALAVADNNGMHVWTEPDYIGAGVYQALTGTVYPGRPLKPAELEQVLKAVQAQAEHTATLKEREAQYASPPANPVVAAMQEAEANRRRELGLDG